MFPIGLSACSNPIDETLFSNYRKAGISAMEICASPSGYSLLNYPEISRLAKQYEITLWSYHLPFSPFAEVEISQKALQKKTILYWSELIKKGADIGIDKFVVHPSGEPIPDCERSERIKYASEGLAELAEIAGKQDAVIAVEDLPRTCLGNCSDEMEQLISLHDGLKVCFDTNHLLGESLTDFVYKLSDRIITLHVSDYDFVNERHWLPGEGKVDWQALFHALQEIHYDGVWLYEIGFTCPKTIFRDRLLTCDDFSANAKSLFEQKAPAVFSKPKPNLGMWE